MLDGKMQTSISRFERAFAGATPRLPDATAWLDALADLEAEFNAILDRALSKLRRRARLRQG
jgi:hypothetical protein